MKNTLLALVATTVFLMPCSALAANYTFQMNDYLTTNGLDHQNAYAWNISGGFNLGAQVVTGATLTFTNFRNWDNNANQLFVYVGATSGGGTGGATPVSGAYTGSTAGFTQTTYAYGDNPGGTVISDYFAANGANALYDANVGNSVGTKNASYGRSLVASPSGFTTTSVPTMTVSLNSVLSDLTKYIGTGATGDFALLLDSDCHYFFSTATLTMTTGAAPTPEPGSILLLLTVLVGACATLRRKRAAILD